MYKRFACLILLLIVISPGLIFSEDMLTWQDCVLEAKKNNPDLISAVEVVNQQKAARGITASSLYPQIDTSLSASTAKSSSSTSSGSSSSTRDSYSYGVTGSQLIFDGFKTINEVNAAKQDIKSAQEGYRFTSSDVRFNLRSAFVNLLAAQELVRVAEEIKEIRKGNLELITLRYQSGLEHKGALLTAEANMAQALFEVEEAKRAVEYAQRQLSKEMGMEEFRPMVVRGDFVVIDAAREKPDFDEIVRNNPSVLQALAKKDSASFGIKSAYANFSPTLTGSAGAGRSSSRWSPQGDQWNLGLSLGMPIFEGGLRLYQVSQARAVYNQAQADERSARDSAIVSLEQTWVDLQDTMDYVGVQLKILQATEERSKIGEAQYSTGFLTFDNWIIIEDDLVSAKRNYLRSQTDALLAEASWIKAKGETLEYAQ